MRKVQFLALITKRPIIFTIKKNKNMSFTHEIIQKYIDNGTITDNTEKTDWKELIGAPVVAALIFVLAAFYFGLI